jgi:uncharacterized protein (TIGR02302 family)
VIGPQGDPEEAASLRRLNRRRAQARLVLLFERAWPAIWPALGVAGAFLCVALLDLPALLPPWLHLAFLAGFGVAAVLLLVRGLAGIGRPGNDAADRRLEAASGLRHRPLSTLADRPASTDSGALALWRVHLARAGAQVRTLRVGWPRPGLARRDPIALRGALIVALFAAFVIAGPDAGTRLARAFRPAVAPAASLPSTQLQAWVTPPSFTGLAPLFLRPEGGAATVPAGSQLTVSVTGGSGAPPALVADGHSEPFQALDAASFQAEHALTAGGRIAVRRRGRDMAGWDITVVADAAPVVQFWEPPGAYGRGNAARALQLRLPWQVAHEYGVVSLQAELRLRDRPDAAPLVIQIPLPGGAPKSARGAMLQDLTPNPWAGLPVVARLVARDAAGAQGVSAEAVFPMPERPFENPVARRLMVVRRMLSLRPDDRNAPIHVLQQIAESPDDFDNDDSVYLTLTATASLLFRDLSQAAVDEAQLRLWQLALHLEEGATERTARALEAARQAVREAMEEAAKSEHPDTSELERRLQQLEQAIQRHMEALLEQARRDDSEMPLDADAQRLDQREMEKLAEEARQAAREGRMEDAQQKLAQLEQMLDQLKNARTARAENNRQRAEKRQRGQQQMGALQDMVHRQGDLLDHSQQRGEPGADQPRPQRGQQGQQGQRQQGQQGERGQQGGGQPGQGQSDPAQQRDADRRVQQALRRALGELMQQFGDLTGEIPGSLGDADRAMRDAGQALGGGQDAEAGAAEQRAIEALQKGGREMSQAMARQFGPGQMGEQGQDAGDEAADADGQDNGMLRDGRGNPRGTTPGNADAQRGRDQRRDPLGRRLRDGTAGADEASDVAVPDEMEQQRTRAIQDELRRRGAERGRPQQELDYIDRLLKQF